MRSLRIILRVILAVSGLLLLAMAAFGQQPTTDPRTWWEIRPGVGLLERPWGQPDVARPTLVLGMTRDRADAGRRATGCDPSWLIPEFRDNVVSAIQVRCGGAARTAQGNQVGTDMRWVIVEFGLPRWLYGAGPATLARIWAYRGIEFTATPDGHGLWIVTMIRVVER